MVDDANAGDAYGGLWPSFDVSRVAGRPALCTMTGRSLAAWASRSIRSNSVSEHGPLTWISGAPPFARAPITIGLLRPWPDVGAPGHLVVGAWLLLCDQFGKRRECFTFETLATR
jgi:hypothetical protein